MMGGCFPSVPRIQCKGRRVAMELLPRVNQIYPGLFRSMGPHSCSSPPWDMFSNETGVTLQTNSNSPLSGLTDFLIGTCPRVQQFSSATTSNGYGMRLDEG